MFDLEQSIAQWRKRMTAAGIAPNVLDELESHLRDELATRRLGEMSDAEAFDAAVKRLGNPGEMREEFAKLCPPMCFPVKLAWLALIALVGVFIVHVVVTGRILQGGVDGLLVAHVVTLTAGDLAAFVPGLLGICYVLSQWLLAPSEAREQSLVRGLVTFTYLATALVLVGVILGTIWSSQFHGVFFNTAPRAVGPTCVLVWLATLWLIQQFRRPSERITVLLAVAGNIIVSLGWFGALIVAAGRTNDGILVHPYLATWIGAHLVVLAIGVVQSRGRMSISRA